MIASVRYYLFMVKGFTVHLAGTDGKAVCGVLNPKGFLGKPGLTTDPRRVTCHKCEKVQAAK
jgi:hypothetical protein